MIKDQDADILISPFCKKIIFCIVIDYVMYAIDVVLIGIVSSKIYDHIKNEAPANETIKTTVLYGGVAISLFLFWWFIKRGLTNRKLRRINFSNN